MWARTKIQASNQCLDNQEEKTFSVNVTNLVKCMSVGEIEKIERVSDPMSAVPDVAFGYLNLMMKSGRIKPDGRMIGRMKSDSVTPYCEGRVL